MGVASDWREVAAAIGAAESVVAVGAGTHGGIGGAVTGATEIRVAAGVVAFEPADMTATVRAGTTCAELAAVLAEHGQECALDPRDPAATIGGVLATGLSGLRRLGLGPLRDHVLEVTFVTADGRVVRGGGPTVKNVTGYDVPRLLVGSLGTLGVLVQVIVRTRPLPVASRWFATSRPTEGLGVAVHRPTAVAWDGVTTHVLLEGQTADVDDQAARHELVAAPPPTLPTGAHRARISVPPGRSLAVGRALDAQAVRWVAEPGVGTIHVATDDPAELAAARVLAAASRGWLLREAGAPDLDPFGTPFPAASVQARLRRALDPTGKLSPGRVPATEPRVVAA